MSISQTQMRSSNESLRKVTESLLGIIAELFSVVWRTWTCRHPPAPKYRNRHDDGVEYLLMGDPNRVQDRVLEGLFGWVIIDEGHRVKGGDLFDRAAAVIELEATYKQFHTATLLSNHISDLKGIADLLEDPESRAAYNKICTNGIHGINRFESTSHNATLARHTADAYASYIHSALQDQDGRNDAVKYLAMIFRNNLLRRLPSSKIPSAVRVHNLWKDGKNPEGVIGNDIKNVYYHTTTMEVSEEDWKAFNTEARALHRLLYGDFMFSRDEDGFISQNSRIIRKMILASNSPFFSRRLTAHARSREAIPTSIHLKVAKHHGEVTRYRKILKDLRTQLDRHPGNQTILQQIRNREYDLQILYDDGV